MAKKGNRILDFQELQDISLLKTKKILQIGWSLRNTTLS